MFFLICELVFLALFIFSYFLLFKDTSIGSHQPSAQSYHNQYYYYQPIVSYHEPLLHAYSRPFDSIYYLPTSPTRFSSQQKKGLAIIVLHATFADQNPPFFFRYPSKPAMLRDGTAPRATNGRGMEPRSLANMKWIPRLLRRMYRARARPTKGTCVFNINCSIA